MKKINLNLNYRLRLIKKRFAIAIALLLLLPVPAFAQTPDALPRWATGGSLVDSILKEFLSNTTRHVGIGTTGSFPVIGGQPGYRTVTIQGNNIGGAVLELINVSSDQSYNEVAKIEMLNINSAYTEVLSRALINVETSGGGRYSRIGFLIRDPGDPDALYVTSMQPEGVGVGTIWPNLNGQARTLTVASGNTCPPFTCVARVGTAAVEIIGNRQGVDGAVALLDFQNEVDSIGSPQRLSSILVRSAGADNQP